jgi:hypothetical protein
MSITTPAEAAGGQALPEDTAGEARALAHDVDQMLLEVASLIVRLDELLAPDGRRRAGDGDQAAGMRTAASPLPSPHLLG